MRNKNSFLKLHFVLLVVVCLFANEKIQAQTINTIAGTGTPAFLDGVTATAGKMSSDNGVAIDASGNIYIADRNNNRVRIVYGPSSGHYGDIGTFAGNGTAGSTGDGFAAVSATLNQPWDVTVDPSGNVYICETSGNRIRQVNSAGIISTFAGTGLGAFGGDGGTASAAKLNSPMGITYSGGYLYIADKGNNRVRRVSLSTSVISTFAGNGTLGWSASDDLHAAISAKVGQPNAVRGDAAGNIYFSCQYNHVVRKVYAATVSGTAHIAGNINTIAGGGSTTGSFSGDGGDATAGTLNVPSGVAVDAYNNVYISDAANNRIRIVTPETDGTTTMASGTITTFAGTGTSATTGNGGAPSSAGIGGPQRLDFDSHGDLFICSNHSVRKIDIDLSISGVNSICYTGSTTLTSSVSGGTWTSSNSAIANVNSTTGVVSGVAAGTVNITYTAATTTDYATFAIFPMTIIGLPAVGCITGSGGVCSGHSATLTVSCSGTPGGTWTTSDATYLTVASTSSTTATISVPAGISISHTSSTSYGAPVITYSVSNLCGTAYATHAVNAAAAEGTITGISSVCLGGSTTLSDLSTGSTYSWTSSVPSVAAISYLGVVSTVSAGTTIISYTVSNTCGTNTAVFPFTVNSLPTITVSPSPAAICIGGAGTTLSASGAVSYSWSPSTGLSSGVVANPIANPASTTSYVVTGTDANGCINSATAVVTVNPLPTISVSPSATAICIGGAGTTITASGAGTGSYSWSPSAGLSSAVVFNPTANPAATTSYIVTGTDANGCVNTATATVTVNPLPVISVTPAIISICIGGAGTTLAASGAGAGSYSWSPSTGLSSAVVSNPLANPTTTTSYVVTGTDANGCVNTATSVVTVNPLPVISISPSAVSICVGGAGATLLASGAGAGSYSWSPSTGLSSAGIYNPLANPTATTSYVVTGTDVNGCVNTATSTVTVIPLPSPGVISGATSVCSMANLPGSGIALTSTVSGGTWSVASVHVASVTGGGEVLGPGYSASGTEVISYTVTNTCGMGIATYSVGYEPIPFAGIITLTSGASTVSSSASATLDPYYTTAGLTGTWAWTTISGGATVSSSITGTSNVVTGIAGAAGDVDISYAVSNSCATSTAHYTIHVNGARGANPNNSGVSGFETLKTYPNPTTGVVILELPGQNDNTILTVMDITGKVVDVKSTNENKISFDMSGYSKGVYLLQVKSGDRYYSEKIVFE